MTANGASAPTPDLRQIALDLLLVGTVVGAEHIECQRVLHIYQFRNTTYPAPRRPPALRHRPRRDGTAGLAQEAEGSG
jgi:hypothetical protein